MASATAKRVGLGPGVERALREAVEWWNGHGPPRGLRGEEIALPARIARAAADAARFDHLGGREAAVHALRRRSGGILGPSLVEAFAASADRLLGETGAGDPRERILEAEPKPVVEIEVAELTRVASSPRSWLCATLSWSAASCCRAPGPWWTRTCARGAGSSVGWSRLP
ncbi:MAG: hypothetical protein ACRDSN_25345, partial [Pseudonocardiaceae bacterium]